ncbi:solute carrier family 22 member 7-like [Physella acuta]|uniref:solute carrier family 22 member 7-like n=1 Tax=Physella acuta TaxID=109671 RepID=UPI0027DC412B|nr:solute carrier family 22 member 7-like [Physella acuta]XP_059153737.1 solute carrier family 22 member 7-like [Physella acuta]XP_059153740.1 solute carrier family 22 member 7-like [Physella acuta]XP_059153741.1 solute carrier family 22 member 7-like [Physella acuta]
MNLSDILKEVGNEGLFQILTLLVLTMPKMPIQWSMTMMSYASNSPKWCCVPQDVVVDTNCETFQSGNSSVISYKSSYLQCHLNSTECDHRVYLPPDGALTAVTEWDLVCEKNWIVSALSSIQMGGVMVGALVSGYLSDLFGRKKVHFASIFLHAVFNVLAGVSISWPMFAVFRFLIGFFIGGYLVVHVPYALEFISPRWRVIPASLPFAAIGASLLPLAAWSLPDWRWMHFVCAIFCAPFLLAYFFMPESMRWLTIKGKVEEAAQVVETIAWVNRKTDYHQKKCLEKIEAIAQKERELKDKGKKYSYIDVYRDWPMAKLTLTQQYVWFTTSLVGYGIILGISNLAGNIYLNMFLVEAVEIPFILITCYFNNCIGRRMTALIYFSFATVAGTLALIFHLVPDLPHKDTGITIMCICCRSFIAGAAAVFVVVSTEVYPTVIRTLGYGAANTAAKVGGVLAPFLINIDSIPTVAYSVISCTCFFCIIAVWSLQETKNLLMEDTLQKTISRRNSTVSKTNSLEKTLSQTDAMPRIFIDLDTDLIHHKSYSEFEDSGDEEVDLEVVSTPPSPAVAVSENLPLLRQRFPMYHPARVGTETDAGVVNGGCDVAGTQSQAVMDTTRGSNPVHEPELKGGYKSLDEGRKSDADGTTSTPDNMTDGRFIREY